MKCTVPTYCHNSKIQNGQGQSLLRRYGLPITTHVILKIQENICQVSKQSLCFIKWKHSTKFSNVCTENLLQNTDKPPNMDESEHNISKFFCTNTSCNMKTLSYPQVWPSQYAGIFVSACPHPQQEVVLSLWRLVDASQVQLHSSLQSRVLHRKTHNR
jgi:hypothetical protein